MSNDIQIKKQIKFAVVMYGGGSLAIYINGVAQELLKLAQATIESDVKPCGTTRIYQKIAHILSGNQEITELQKKIFQLTKDKAAPQNIKAVNDEIVKELNKKKPTVEFIIDVLTGSSAGGINAVFLAKALVNGAKNMSDLQKLWLDQGDFAKLLNDRHSVADNGLNSPQEPASLLNSQRMYLELLKALDGLDKQKGSAPACIKEKDLLDLYVTYTDFKGLPTNLALSDKTVLERVHKRVFNFRFENGKNDFVPDKNPFLAFAARCTSSFPFAFEPMRLTEIDDIITGSLPNHESDSPKFKKWMPYFSDLTDENGKSVEWKDRWFVDGGCLDNKPFGYAIDKLTQRTGEGIIERKLLYIEPNPENFRSAKNRDAKPNALENVFGQASGLPGYETIREDLQRILDRNRMIERVNRLIGEIEKDFDRNKDWFKDDNSVVWKTADLKDVGDKKGAAFIPYYRLRISSTTDEIARLVTRCFKIDDASDHFNVLRSLIRTWRDENYFEYKSDRKPDQKEPQTLNNFLYQYDVEYRLRRLRFVLQKTDYLLRCKDEILHSCSVFEVNKKNLMARDDPETITGVTNTNVVKSPQASVYEAWMQESYQLENYQQENYQSDEEPAEINEAEYIDAVIKIQGELSQIYLQLRRENDFLRENIGDHNLGKTVFSNTNFPFLPDDVSKFQTELTKVGEKLIDLEKEKLELEKLKVEKRKREDPNFKPECAAPESVLPPEISGLNRILKQLSLRQKKVCSGISGSEGADILEKVYPGQKTEPLTKALKEAAQTLGEKLFNKKDAFLRKASTDAKAVLGINEKENAVSVKTGSTRELKFVRRLLGNYYERFDSYDQIGYPLFFESPVGEAVKVDVVRISSRDAHSLINEEDPAEKRRKLAGDYLFAFGAFLDPRWRLNDIMWGRLDGAERLIETLLPGEEFEEIRESLIDEANKTILTELLIKDAQSGFQGTVVDALTLASTEAIQRDAVDKLVLSLQAPAIETGLNNALTLALEDSSLCGHFKSVYEVNRRLEPQPTLKIISRSTQIIGKILQNITEEQVQMGDRLSWITKFSQIFWGLVTVAAPNSIWNLLFNYWIQLLYLFEIIVIAGSTIFAQAPLQQFGIIALIVTLGVHLTVISLQEMMLGNTFWKILLRFLIGGILTIFALAGVLMFYSVFFDADAFNKIAFFQAQIIKPEYARWQKLLPLVPFGILFIVLALWREVEKLRLEIIGRAIIIGFLGFTALNFYFVKLTTGKFFGTAPLLALEFVKDGADLTAQVGKLGVFLEGVRTALWVDSFAFVPLYLGFLLILSAVLRRRRQTLATVAAVIAALCSISAALFDFSENYYSIQGLSADKTNAERIAAAILWSAQIKWTLIFVAIGLLSAIFWRSGLKNLWNAAALLLVLGAVLGIIGTFFNPPLVPVALITEFMIFLFTGILFELDKLRKHFLRNY